LSVYWWGELCNDLRPLAIQKLNYYSTIFGIIYWSRLYSTISAQLINFGTHFQLLCLILGFIQQSGILFNNLGFLFINPWKFDILQSFNQFGIFLLIWVSSSIFGYIWFSNLNLFVSIWIFIGIYHWKFWFYLVII